LPEAACMSVQLRQMIAVVGNPQYEIAG